MNTVRNGYLSRRFNEWLDRFAPPRRIQNDQQAMQRDADAMLATILRHAPHNGYEDWLPEVLRRLEDGMTTRSWPAPGELARACRTVGSGSGARQSDDATEAACVQMMADWFVKHRNQMPSMGRTSRTAALIKMGILADEREANFFRFDLDERQMRAARKQRIGRAEWNHHVRVMTTLRGVTLAEAEQEERDWLNEYFGGEQTAPTPPASAPVSATFPKRRNE